jgi:hypothetical protein
MNKSSKDVLDLLLDRRFVIIKRQKLRSTKEYRSTKVTDRMTWMAAYDEYKKLLLTNHSPKSNYDVIDDFKKNKNNKLLKEL